jgi:multicomponent Na+:H+ antiporter subunit G
MQIFLNIMIIILLILGLFFFFVGAIGLIRMPDVFCRMHATTKCDTMGAGLIFMALMIWKGFTFTSLTIFIILIFIWLTNPTAAHYIAKSAYQMLFKNTEKKE